MKQLQNQSINKITLSKCFFSNLIGKRAVVIMSAQAMSEWKIIFPKDEAEMERIRIKLSENNVNFLVFYSQYIGNIFTYIDRNHIQVENLSKNEILYFHDSQYSVEYLKIVKRELEMLKNSF